MEVTTQNIDVVVVQQLLFLCFILQLLLLLLSSAAVVGLDVSVVDDSVVHNIILVPSNL